MGDLENPSRLDNFVKRNRNILRFFYNCALITFIFIGCFVAATTILDESGVDTTGNFTSNQNISATNIYVNGSFYEVGEKLIDKYFKATRISEYLNLTGDDYVRIGTDYWNTSFNETLAKVVNFTTDSIMANHYYNFPIYTYNSSYAIDSNLDWTDLWNLSENETSAKVVNLSTEFIFADMIYGDGSKITGITTSFGPGIADYLNVSTYDSTDFWNLSINVTSAKADNLTANSLMVNYLYGGDTKITGSFAVGNLNITNDMNSSSVNTNNITANSLNNFGCIHFISGGRMCDSA